ncbi:hypothetical protein TNCV_2782201 [Trichonephila clavipes]|nr:hypothetical protein TNCV_2782201 [Trichonephila clavipes]
MVTENPHGRCFRISFPASHVAVVAEWSRYWIVAGLVTSARPVPLKIQFKPSIKDPPCRETMHVKFVESSNVLPLVWCVS